MVVPVGGWAVAINDGVAYNATLAAGTYSGPTAVVTAWIAAIQAAAIAAGSVKTFVGSIASGEQGTGKTTITINSGTFALTWTATNLRNLLGWSAGLAAAGTYTSPSGCLGMWLPDCTIAQPFPLGDAGNVEASISQTSSPLGATKTIYTSSRTHHPGIAWTHVTLARARQGSEASGVRSWERFVRDCMIGSSGLSYFLPGGDVKIFWNADSASTPTPAVYHPIVPRSVADAMEPSTGDGYVGLYRCKWLGGFS